MSTYGENLKDLLAWLFLPTWDTAKYAKQKYAKQKAFFIFVLSLTLIDNGSAPEVQNECFNIFYLSGLSLMRVILPFTQSVLKLIVCVCSV
jgi:hypothetical protein